MFGFERCEELIGWPPFALTRLLETLANSLGGVGPGRDIQQALIGFGVL